jgi:SAM-dependent methyltransferase
MKLDQLIYSKLLGRPYHPTARRFEEERQLALDSATAVVAKINDIMPVGSVVDVGCGVGNWLSVFAQQGADRIIGIDGDYIDRRRLAIERSCFVPWDLNRPLAGLKLGRFDLAMSLEVGEHLLPSRADCLVDDLCALSDVVLYGAAIVSQHGEDHINEQWQSFWAGKFEQRGYVAFDVLRPVIWDDARVAYWYRQNTIFYLKRGTPAYERFARRFAPASPAMIDVVHPDLFIDRMNVKRGVRRLAKNIHRMALQIAGRFPAKASKAAGDGHLAMLHRNGTQEGHRT